ncbi:MAG: calcium-binding protein [Solirubrobacteraceae bacterium]
MAPAQHANTELDALIEEITIDAHDQDEQLMGFENAFDEDANLPCHGTVIGEQVEVLSVSRANNRHELTATCQRNGQRYEIALLDINLNTDPDTTRLIAAYHRWLRA